MDIYTLLKQDHEELMGFVDELVSLRASDDYRKILLEEIKHALVPHSRAEESVLYNSIRAVVSEKSDIMHAYQDHVEAESYLRALQIEDAANLDWKPTALKLKEALEHHIEEEENEMFAEAKTMFTAEEAEQMGQAFQEMKTRVEKEGFVRTSFDLIVNLMPPRLVEQVKGMMSLP